MRGTVDSQLIEIIGRNRLINELLRGGLEVATPLRDRGIDLIAYHYFGVIAVRRRGSGRECGTGPRRVWGLGCRSGRPGR